MDGVPKKTTGTDCLKHNPPTYKVASFSLRESKNRLVDSILSLPRTAKRACAVVNDGLLAILAVWLSLSLIERTWVSFQADDYVLVAGSLLISFPIFAYFGIYRAIFRYAGWNAMMGLAKAAILYAFVYGLLFTVAGVSNAHPAVGVMQPLLFFVMVMASRVFVRYWFGDQYNSASGERSLPSVLIYGAGSAGRQLAVALARGQEHRVVGFLDDDERLHNNRLDGRLIYKPSELGTLIPTLEVTDILLAMPSIGRQRHLEILEELRQFPVHIQTLPGMADLVSGKVGYNDLRELDIEDLLGRDPVIPNGILMNKNIRGRTVLVTGAGGSIGGELCRQILSCSPEKLLLVDHSESALYEIHKSLLELVEHMPNQRRVIVVPLIASVQNEPLITEIMQTWAPHTVYHAAAYKHVPMVEHNPIQGISNNVGGTLACARAAVAAQVSNFVLISSDKAVRPTNVMGASKRLSEMILQALAERGTDGQGNSSKTCFCMVRFGNVLGSAGSVVPLFREQIRRGGPITLTHADITRYFMTMSEAAQLVIQAGAMASPGDVFVLDMGDPVRIFELAKRMIELSGLSLKDADNPNGNIEIQITGLRPGEKLYEELLIGGNPMRTQHPRIMKAEEEFYPWQILGPHLDRLFDLLDEGDVVGSKLHLKKLINGYQPSSGLFDYISLEKSESEVA